MRLKNAKQKNCSPRRSPGTNGLAVKSRFPAIIATLNTLKKVTRNRPKQLRIMWGVGDSATDSRTPPQGFQMAPRCFQIISPAWFFLQDHFSRCLLRMLEGLRILKSLKMDNMKEHRMPAQENKLKQQTKRLHERHCPIKSNYITQIKQHMLQRVPQITTSLLRN